MKIPYKFLFKWVGRYSAEERMLRLIRIAWPRHGGPGGSEKEATGKRTRCRVGYCASVTLAIRPRLFLFHRELHGVIVTVFGLRIHYRKSYGGWVV